uniref:Uncharacterized protein n=1 Tax=Mycena chlorophos TaxID=658473 RepID=A0ABQ0LLI4_MYCCL|nr:predicted protein [Mycena chlorophos]
MRRRDPNPSTPVIHLSSFNVSLHAWIVSPWRLPTSRLNRRRAIGDAPSDAKRSRACHSARDLHSGYMRRWRSSTRLPEEGLVGRPLYRPAIPFAHTDHPPHFLFPRNLPRIAPCSWTIRFHPFENPVTSRIIFRNPHLDTTPSPLDGLARNSDPCGITHRRVALQNGVADLAAVVGRYCVLLLPRHGLEVGTVDIRVVATQNPHLWELRDARYPPRLRGLGSGPSKRHTVGVGPSPTSTQPPAYTAATSEISRSLVYSPLLCASSHLRTSPSLSGMHDFTDTASASRFVDGVVESLKIREVAAGSYESSDECYVVVCLAFPACSPPVPSPSIPVCSAAPSTPPTSLVLRTYSPLPYLPRIIPIRTFHPVHRRYYLTVSVVSSFVVIEPLTLVPHGLFYPSHLAFHDYTIPHTYGGELPDVAGAGGVALYADSDDILCCSESASWQTGIRRCRLYGAYFLGLVCVGAHCNAGGPFPSITSPSSGGFPINEQALTSSTPTTPSPSSSPFVGAPLSPLGRGGLCRGAGVT